MVRIGLQLSTMRGDCDHVKDYASREGCDDVPVGDEIVGYDRLTSRCPALRGGWMTQPRVGSSGGSIR